VVSAPEAVGVRVWHLMSREPGLGARRTPPESASVGHSLVAFCRTDSVTGQVIVIDGGAHFH